MSAADSADVVDARPYATLIGMVDSSVSRVRLTSLAREDWSRVHGGDGHRLSVVLMGETALSACDVSSRKSYAGIQFVIFVVERIMADALLPEPDAYVDCDCEDGSDGGGITWYVTQFP